MINNTMKNETQYNGSTSAKKVATYVNANETTYANNVIRPCVIASPTGYDISTEKEYPIANTGTIENPSKVVLAISNGAFLIGNVMNIAPEKNADSHPIPWKIILYLFVLDNIIPVTITPNKPAMINSAPIMVASLVV